MQEHKQVFVSFEMAKRKAVAIDLKLELIKCVENGDGPSVLARKYELAESTVRSIFDLLKSYF